MDSSSYEALIQELRRMALAGHRVLDLVQTIESVTGVTDAFGVCGPLASAFGISVGNMKRLAGWRGFGGPMSDEDFERQLRDLISTDPNRWTQFDGS